MSAITCACAPKQRPMTSPTIGVKKAVENLPQLRDKLAAICDNYLTVQQDILETFVDRGQLRKLAEPTVLPSGERIPGLKLDNPRQLTLLHALVRFTHIAAGSTFTTAELYPHVLAALQMSADQYSLASLRYDLSKLRAKRWSRSFVSPAAYDTPDAARMGYQGQSPWLVSGGESG
jgi:hypothetical protein